ncbi:MAG: 1-(5-phosphoribosyl)-5-[(5-phosphoribosylamino)methylideneamino]imidazole-4-carboxamide isomerase [Phascolarctobacterium sp.]|uniref:1-(5-phosphoribosyl)-5-[(5- phosphoribosylamino)methylideneamino]imidazole-4- carboxamide isomerase n=1 Tax=Phascolarctobacterium sp. TaxID=2049039 RepID=UPI0026DB90F4|nr:1-(5-phosphoribosyl)-5-[(5-phosphoribosylamino)methylideneamino]imidazole-4-carboxamide isomerase [Phascolarctobacterium sp.]MDO4921430.1 1-(5-phosphoribosyl)-5-[(5-phosphoribosylamino)methylideneamino]imidazole-4-carboxamide isomerase [Phascolarctobacterium sp.]
MIIYPAIDIRGGRCVRLTEGRFDAETVFADDPAEMALKWAACGAQWLHLVDLDGALAGEGKNLPVIERILQSVKLPVQLGGGIRNMQAIDKLLTLGVQRVILGSAAVKNPELVAEACRQYPGHIAVGIDAKNGDVAIEGWGRGSGVPAVELAKQMAAYGVDKIIFTDISRDGMLSGVNAEATAALARACGIEIIASGGVASLEDIRRVKAVEADGVTGCIIGKAIYTGAVDLREALALAKEE